ncbi:RNA polymerase-binding protein RbpA [Allokutzneria albata]|uniref:RNA polymerase-binding protein n=1 Tax=Allokutzneria albata TaxID=211114 RepID=A0A1G9YAS2_ALLAB|nr:RNA polymerase-binding protein RbpA [Allokutzneria albata]SDN06152.1 RNA polymerase-binding protein [Allokutzneria albata]
MVTRIRNGNAHMRGAKGHRVSYERLLPEHAPTVMRMFRCPKGSHEFAVTFSGEATELPEVWECSQHGVQSVVVTAPDAAPQAARARTHWHMLIERRSIPELDALLAERLELLRQGRPY